MTSKERAVAMVQKSNSVERRAQGSVARATEEKEGRKVEGYAALFDSRSELICGLFYEYIDRGAFDGVIEKSDVLALLNHSTSRGVLARSKFGDGTLTLSIDDKGLRYEFDAPNTALGDELLEGLRRGDISASSFGFDVKAEVWEEVEGVPTRHILKVGKLYDVSPVYHPAYEGTTVSARSLEQAKWLEEKPKEGNTRGNYVKYKYL